MFIVSIIFLLLLSPQLVFSAERISVIYPELSPPYKGVFDTILQGIADTQKNKIVYYPLPRDYQLKTLQQALAENRTDGIISLGKRGYHAAKQLGTKTPIVAGALSMVPNGISGVSLSADPDKLFNRLKSLVPACKRVFVVYSEKNNGWLIPLAQKAANNNGLQLLAYAAKDLREAMHHYRNLLSESRKGTDAIWLPLDNITVNDDVVLPLLLQKAWDNSLAVISNKPAHTKRGVLFSMYPDNYGLGQALAELLNRLSATAQKSQVIPLSQLQLAVNLRTAAHLGLSFTLRQQEDFTLTFPTR